jgi:hypothetical protein
LPKLKFHPSYNGTVHLSRRMHLSDAHDPSRKTATIHLNSSNRLLFVIE